MGYLYSRGNVPDTDTVSLSATDDDTLAVSAGEIILPNRIN